MKIIAVAALGFLILCLPMRSQAAADGPYRMKCDYFETQGRHESDVLCSVTYSKNSDGRLVETVQFNARTVRIVYLSRQGQWARVTINGKPGMRYEIYREEFSYSTDDLTEFLNLRSG
jgi:hypothetical protein